MDSPIFSSDHATAPEWAVAKGFFAELVNVTRRKVRWPGAGESGGGLGGMDKEDREAYDRWRRDAGEVIVCAQVQAIERTAMCADVQVLHIAGRHAQGFD